MARILAKLQNLAGHVNECKGVKQSDEAKDKPTSEEWYSNYSPNSTAPEAVRVFGTQIRVDAPGSPQHDTAPLPKYSTYGLDPRSKLDFQASTTKRGEIEFDNTSTKSSRTITLRNAVIASGNIRHAPTFKVAAHPASRRA